MTSGMPVLLVASGTEVVRVDLSRGTMIPGHGLSEVQPTCLASHRREARRAWCGTSEGGVFRTDDGGRSWHPVGLDGAHVMALAVGPAPDGPLWAGTEPSALWRSSEGEADWEARAPLDELPSSGEWAFPPRPDTHHVRWIACHPADPERLWLAIEAGALVRTEDGGASWTDRVPDGPRDTHELAIHPDAPDRLRVAAGDGYFESRDGGRTWASPTEGLEVGYLRSVAVDPGDPDTILVSASSRARTAYVAGHSDGRVYRREGGGRWKRVLDGWPERPRTIAPLLRAGRRPGEFWAADERGVHRSGDGGRSWDTLAGFLEAPSNLRGFTLLSPMR